MRFSAAVVLLGVAVMAVASGCGQEARGQEVAGRVTAFVHVNVVPMDRERVLRDQTVVVQGERITAFGPSQTGIPVCI